MAEAQMQYPIKSCGCGCGEPVIITGLGDKPFIFIGAGDSRERIYFLNNDHSALWQARQDPAQLELPIR